MPDVNSLPSSPRPPPSLATVPSRTPSRQASYRLASPSAPHSPSIPAQGLLPMSNPTAIVPPGTVENLSSAEDNRGVGMGPGPVRHPRPLTAADLHLQLEKEQEAVVNRLTRELSVLRQQ